MYSQTLQYTGSMKQKSMLRLGLLQHKQYIQNINNSMALDLSEIVINVHDAQGTVVFRKLM